MADILKELEKENRGVDAVAVARARNKRVREAVSKAKTGVGKGVGALRALRGKKGK